MSTNDISDSAEKKDGSSCSRTKSSSSPDPAEASEPTAPKRPRHPLAQQFITTEPPRKRVKDTDRNGHPASTSPAEQREKDNGRLSKKFQAVGAIRFLHFQGLSYDKESLFSFFDISKESEREIMVEVSKQEWTSREEREFSAKWRMRDRMIAIRAERMRREELKS